MKILMTGGTGLIGQELGLELVRRGHQIVLVSRSREKAILQAPFPCEVIEGDLTQGPLDPTQTRGLEAVIHLLGEGVAEKRWTPEQKQKILDSRVNSTRNLLQSFEKAPSTFVSASAIGYYGDRAEETLGEDAKPGEGFLPDVCVQWEREVDRASQKGFARVVKARIGIVLATQGGALAEMLTPFQAGVGGALGNGQQWMSWIHIRDIVGLFVKVVEDTSIHGAVNFVAPEPVRNLDFSTILARTLGRMRAPNVPKLALKALFGELAVVLLASQKVSSKRAQDLGYKFQFATLEEALQDLLAPHSQGEEILVTKQFIPKRKEEIFPFFADAKNLESITPELLNFNVLDISTPDIQEGTLINYKLKIRGVPVRWRTRIEEWRPPFKFVDTALKGPYKLWHHTHSFEDLGSGTLMTDRVRYRLPVGYLGWLSAHWLVKKDVRNIFDFRRHRIAEIFGIKTSKNP